MTLILALIPLWLDEADEKEAPPRYLTLVCTCFGSVLTDAVIGAIYRPDKGKPQEARASVRNEASRKFLQERLVKSLWRQRDSIHVP
jgi:hypothetical protein